MDDGHEELVEYRRQMQIYVLNWQWQGNYTWLSA